VSKIGDQGVDHEVVLKVVVVVVPPFIELEALLLVWGCFHGRDVEVLGWLWWNWILWLCGV